MESDADTPGDFLWLAGQLPPGLLNLGNSCYMNTALQTLASSRRFCAFLHDQARNVTNSMTRVREAAAQGQRSFDRWGAPLKKRYGGDASALSAAAGHKANPSPTSPMKAAAAAMEAVDAATAMAEPLVQLLIRTLCRIVLWIQGWEPPPPAKQQQQHLQQPPQRLHRQSVRSPLAAAVCAPVVVAPANLRRRSRWLRPSPSPSSWPPLPPHPPLQRLAAATLLLQLDGVLQKLQPSYNRIKGGRSAVSSTVVPCRLASRGGPVDPSALLAALRNHLPGDAMRLGQQNDAAEALACLCDALDTELAAWYMLYGRWIQSPLLQVCEATTATAAGEDVAEAVHWRNTGILLAAATTSTSPAPAGSQSRHGPGSQRQCPGVKQVAIVGTTQPPPSSSSPPSGCECIHPFVGASSAQLASANPLRGLTATTSTCCLCGGMSAARLEPFWSLQLPLPPPPPPSCSSSSRAVPACSATGGPASARLHHYRHRLHGAMAATAIGSGVESVGMLGRRRPLLPSLDPDALGAVTAVPSGMQQQQQQQSHPVLPATTTRPALGAAPASSERDGGAPSGGSLALADCLELAVQAEEVEGVDCCRCSLLAAVRRVRAIVRTKGPGTAAHSATVPPPSQYTILDPDLDPAPDQGLEAGTATGAGTSCRHSSLGPDGRGDCLSAEECMGLTTPEADDQSMQVTEGSTMAGVKRQSVGPGMANGGAVTTATASFQLEQQLMRLEDMLSGPHLPDLDLDIELKGLTELIAQQQQQWRRLQQLSGGVCAAAVAAPAAALTPVRARALRRTRVVSCPPVLVLQLLRTVWDSRTGLTAKDGRHVAFPVELGPRELALLGAAAAVATRPQHEEEQEEEKQGGSVARDENEPALCVIGDGKKWVPEVKGGSLPTAVPSPPPPAYTLTAVVVHYGSPESGHYLMYRRISTLLRREEVSRNCGAPAAATATASATDTATAAAATAAGGTGEHNSCISEYSCSCAWLRVSDSSVMLADEGEVLQQSAAVLLYEMQ